MNRLAFRIIAASVVLMASGCAEDILLDELPGGEDSNNVRVSIRSGGGGTRAVEDGESGINNCQIIVFLSSSGEKKAYCRSDDGSPVSLSVPSGTRLLFCAVANTSEDLSKIQTYKQFSSKKSYFVNNTLENMEMVGVYETTVTADGDITIPMERFLCKISCGEIYYSLICGYSESLVDGLTCEPLMRTAYLQKVPSDCPYSLDGPPAEYLYQDGSYSAMVSTVAYASANHTDYISFLEDGEFSTPSKTNSQIRKRMAAGEQYWLYNEKVCDLYCYPNLSKYSGEENRTQLILQLEGCYRNYKGYQANHRHYFTFTLPELKNNMEYVIPRIVLGLNGENGYPIGTQDFPLSVVAEYEVQTRGLSDGKLYRVDTLRQVIYEKHNY